MKKRQRRAALITALEARYGKDSQRLIDQLERIAFGKKIEVETDIPNVVKTLTPSISEMHAACLDLLAYQHGKPSQNLDVSVDDQRPRWDPDALSLQELETLERLADKATRPLLAVDTTFTVVPEGSK